MPLVLSQVPGQQCQYPGGQCYELRMQKCKNNTNWTLHGLWPEWYNGCEGPDFNISLLDSIREEMDTKWPSCPEYGESVEEFWGHEWSKHGTCSHMEQLEYFTKALELHDKYESHCQLGQPQCSVCFSEDFLTLEQCPNGFLVLA